MDWKLSFSVFSKYVLGKIHPSFLCKIGVKIIILHLLIRMINILSHQLVCSKQWNFSSLLLVVLSSSLLLASMFLKFDTQFEPSIPCVYKNSTEDNFVNANILCFTVLHRSCFFLFFFFYKLKIFGNWVKQVSWCHFFFNSTCSFYVSVVFQ